MTDNAKNEGEGNRTAARRYNKDTREFVETDRVDKKAQEAREALNSEEGEKLKRAEEKGRSKARQ